MWHGLMSDVTTVSRDVSEACRLRQGDKQVYMSLPRPGVSIPLFSLFCAKAPRPFVRLPAPATLLVPSAHIAYILYTICMSESDVSRKRHLRCRRQSVKTSPNAITLLPLGVSIKTLKIIGTGCCKCGWERECSPHAPGPCLFKFAASDSSGPNDDAPAFCPLACVSPE